MTNDEKWYEYCRTKKLAWWTNDDEEREKRIYFDGIAEGERIGKEKQWIATGKAQKKTSAKIKDLKKGNAELKKEISVLLSCANCPENKGGYICEKEYNDKCLSQKIEYIKELKEENEELSNSVTELTNTKTELENKVTELEKENAEILEDNDTLNKWIDELKAQIEKMKCCGNCSNFNSGNCKFSLRIRDDVTTFVKMHEDFFCVNYDKWGLAE